MALPKKSRSGLRRGFNLEDCDVGGIGGTLAGNALFAGGNARDTGKSFDRSGVRENDSAGETVQ